MTRTLKLGFCVSLGFHATVAVGWKCFWHAPSLPSGEDQRPISITLVAGQEIEAARPPAPPTAMAAAPVEPPKPGPEPAPEPAPVSVASVPVPIAEEVRPVPNPVEPPPAPATERNAAAPQPVAAPSPRPPLTEPVPGWPATTAASIANARNVASDSTRKPDAPPGVRARPIYRINPEPAYPAAARRRRQEGLVLLAVKVSAQGRAVRVDLKQTSGFPALDEAALQAVRGWEFEPARISTVAVESEIEVPVRFKLTN